MSGAESFSPRSVLAELRAALAAVDRGTADRESVARALAAILKAQIALIEELVPPVHEAAPEPAPASRPEPKTEPAPAAAAPAVAGAAPSAAASSAIEAFPLEDLNRWLDSGTIFQIRGDLVFLNVRSMGGLKVDEMKENIRRLGFESEVGRLEVVGLRGEVCLFRRA